MLDYPVRCRIYCLNFIAPNLNNWQIIEKNIESCQAPWVPRDYLHSFLTSTAGDIQGLWYDGNGK